MSGRSLKVFVSVLLFGLLLGASATANADTLVITSINFGNLQFMPSSGTAVFTPTGASVTALAQNTLGQSQTNGSTGVQGALASATVNFASAFGLATSGNTVANAAANVSLPACGCTASSFAQSGFTGTLVITGGVGSVDVTISGLPSAMGSLATDGSGLFAEAEIVFDLTVNGTSLLLVDMLRDVNGPNQTGQFQLLSSQLSHAITLQYGVVNTIGVRVSAHSIGVAATPEPATVVLLVSGLGFMTGVLRKRRKTFGE